MKNLYANLKSRKTVLILATLAVAKTLVVVVGSLAFAFFSTAVEADDDVGTLRSFDSNGDQTISVDEARTATKRQFGNMDKNRDGALSENEYVEARLAKISELDANNDGQITREEVRTRMKSRFSGMTR